MRNLLLLALGTAVVSLTGCTNGSDVGSATYAICCGADCCCPSLGDGRRINNGDRNPANPCEICDPSMTQTAWTPVPDCDAGMAGTDAGTDAGPADTDGGSADTDAGSTGTDAGSTGTDSGTGGGTDSGTSGGTDAGTGGGTDDGGCTAAPVSSGGGAFALLGLLGANPDSTPASLGLSSARRCRPRSGPPGRLRTRRPRPCRSR